jgi:hypothetical protein
MLSGVEVERSGRPSCALLASKRLYALLSYVAIGDRCQLGGVRDAAGFIVGLVIDDLRARSVCGLTAERAGRVERSTPPARARADGSLTAPATVTKMGSEHRGQATGEVVAAVRRGRGGVGLLVACIAGGGLISQVAIVGAATSRPAVHAAANTLSLTQRVLSAGEFAGMKPSASPSVTTGAAAWAAGNASQAKQLRSLDFIAGVSENLVTSGNQNRYGLSLVMRFKSAAGAASELKIASSTNGPWKYFTVTGIPGARGFEGGNKTQGGVNVAFTVGPYYYLEGAGWQSGSTNVVSNSTTIAVAQRIYHRVIASSS